MMKIFTLPMMIAMFLLASTSLQSKEIKVSDQTATLKVKAKTDFGLVLRNTVGSFNYGIIQNEGTNYTQLKVGDYSKTEKIGYPSLPVIRQLIEIPQGASIKVNIISYDLKEYQLSEFGGGEFVYPCQGPQTKCGDDEGFKIDSKVYKTNKFLKDELAKAEVVGTMRNQRLALVSVSPFEYNPVTNVIRVYENLEFEISFENADFAATQDLKSRYYSPYFTGMQKSILNYIPLSQRENLTQYPVKYVIVSDPMFSENLQVLIDWKKQKGFTVVEAYTDVIGSTKEEIKTYLQGLYNNGTVEDPAPSFIVFVGDIDQI